MGSSVTIPVQLADGARNYRLSIRSGVVRRASALATAGFGFVGLITFRGGAGKLRSENTDSHSRHHHQLRPAGVMRILSSLWATPLLLFCTLLPPTTWALHESEAGVVDWQKTFIGVPRSDESQAAPGFLRVKGKGNETTSLVIFATETTVGAVDPVDGSVGECGST